MTKPKYEYTGDQTKLTIPYLPSEELKEAVKIAIALERPLLIKGEPGCGKTKLARAVAEELALPYFEWPIKSTSRARDGLYIYDAIGRLRDAQLPATELISEEERRKIVEKFNDPESYISWGAIGKAFRSDRPDADDAVLVDDLKRKFSGRHKAVVLIDEIDKADIDFPNDLLHELEQHEFKVEETDATITAATMPIVFITSNDEKELSDAFLRRCIFFYIKFPEPEDKILEKIVSHHVKLELDDPLITRAVNRFWELRNQMEDDIRHSGKKVSTSELIDWVKYLNMMYPKRDKLPDLTQRLLFPSILLKSKEHHDRHVDKSKSDVAKEDDATASNTSN